MPPLLITVIMLTLSNVFMTFAWYGHLKFFHNRVWIIAALVSWGIALFEYLLQVPANRIGYEVASAGQLKIIQEVLSLAVFIPFSLYILKEPFKMDYIWAMLCLIGAVFFMFRDKIFS
ncbi:DMT family protein [Zophobihabitans entericus]|uniref:DMT family protein n=1 Tax=Zophobihabitans entericus TaxID=1635327 RepID=A0A6G9IES7_9GAMM|nr:DMT family protein [Zophobihabitans entericus]QIQ22309.1 DMT family protein [Zophobihabitans entericus]